MTGRAVRWGVSDEAEGFVDTLALVGQAAQTVIVIAAHLIFVVGLPVAFVGLLRVQGLLDTRPTGDEIVRQLATAVSVYALLALLGSWKGASRRFAVSVYALAAVATFALTAEGIDYFAVLPR